ncbi:cysteine-rich RLK (RECEPTOR-like protein kinase) 26 [Artemisia annua]|uniref:Cysteine-rich RLK (RECEPTOR-like protein kinase) 26 n=1 Tax=Artemisia annua TaxID=35608 RepID=A0A2U1LDP9_ARTAN|nr:cysteine-rich RLK (RECEPTOR-like protein kinase) 26 [Artemisia annua]
MLILTGKLPLVFLLIFLHLVITITLAQPGFIFYKCEDAANYTGNSPYDRNLNTTLSTLPNTNSGFGFFNSSTGQGNDTVYSVALCRGDVNPDACLSCLNDSIVRLRRKCPNQKEAIGYYDNCMLKYSNQIILGSTQIKFYVNYTNPENASDVDRFNGALSPLLNNLTREASTGGSLLKFATGNTLGPGLANIYALVQCTPDLTQQQCNECLGDIISRFSYLYSGLIGGRTLVPMCNFRYEVRPFYNENTLASPPPPNLQGLSPSSGTNTSKTRTVIIVTISVTVSVIILISSICIFIRLRNKPQQTPSSDNTDTVTMDIGTAEPLQYSFNRVKDATNDFAEENKLGKGGFGAVYKGKLEDGEEIAVKRLAKDSRQGHKQFKNEVSALKELRHRNLVRLLGYSIEGSERLLIYEFLRNASLDHIFVVVKKNPFGYIDLDSFVVLNWVVDNMASSFSGLAGCYNMVQNPTCVGSDMEDMVPSALASGFENVGPEKSDRKMVLRVKVSLNWRFGLKFFVK